MNIHQVLFLWYISYIIKNKGEFAMKNKIKNAISKAVSNKNGTGEIAVILLLMVLGMFFLTKILDIPFPFTKEAPVEQGDEITTKEK